MQLKTILNRVQKSKSFVHGPARWVNEAAVIKTAHAPGHFYSPVVDPAELATWQEQLWPAPPTLPPGIDFNHQQHVKVLERWFPRHYKNYDYPETAEAAADEIQFYTRNSQFSWLDSRLLFVLLMALKPRRIIEVGSGFSSLLMADIKTRLGSQGPHITCIEPYPREFLRHPNLQIDQLIVEKVQNVKLDLFLSLKAGDILFIDSSHVIKTGSDVQYLYLEILPRIPTEVLVHIHDIFLPAEYPKEWALEENRSWNEQYLLQALLAHSNKFSVFFGCCYAHYFLSESLSKALGRSGKPSYGGGSFWIKSCR